MKNSHSWDRIIIFRQGQFGDTLVGFPLIEGLHRLFPCIPITYCTNAFRSKNIVMGKEVAALSPYVDKVATYYVEDPVTVKWFELKKQLSAKKSDLLLYLPYGQATPWQIARDWLFFKSIGFHQLYGFREAWQWANSWLKMTPPLPKETDRLLKIARDAGLPVTPPSRCALQLDEKWAEQKWREWNLKERPVLAVCPGSKMQSKRWPIRRYIELGQQWRRKTGAALLIVGGPEEEGIASQILKEWAGYGFSGCGATLSQTAAILSRARAYCGNDTGSMHLAAIQGIPCVAIFSSQQPAGTWFPFGESHVILRNEIPCSNCMFENCYADPPECLQMTSVQKVLAALKAVWQN